MTLQVRRGTNSERLGITPLQGELIFTTDTKQLYVGDGATAGGITSIANTIDSLLADNTPQLGGELDLNGNNITGTGNINITGTITASGNINLGDGAGSDVITVGGAIEGNLTPDITLTHDLGTLGNRWRDGFFSSLDVLGHIKADSIQSDLIADDSTIAWNQTGNLFTGTFVGPIQGNVTGNVTGNVIGSVTGNVIGSVIGGVEGDVQGSVFGDDSTLLVDGVNNELSAQVAYIETLTFVEQGEALDGVNITSSTNGESKIRLVRPNILPNGSPSAVGTLFFDTYLNNGDESTTAFIQSYGSENPLEDYAKSYLELNVIDGSGNVTADNAMTMTWDGKTGFGTFDPAEKLDVRGNATVTGFVQFGSLTTTQRDALTAANGMVIYNTTDNKFQGRENGAWVNLV
jgi:uncharacterized protein YcfJ